MKQLLAGVVILFVVGFGSFLYRNIMERPSVTAPEVACTMEAKLCPDGSSVGRTGPRCEFAACAFPNVEAPSAGVAFVAPPGYMKAEAGEAGTLLTLTKPSLSGDASHTISVWSFPIGEGGTADNVIMSTARFQPADEPATDLSRFRDLKAGPHAFREVTTERFEALVRTGFYLVREKDVLLFEVTEHDVTDWMEPGLEVRTLPEHAALIRALGTLQASR